ncbi:hypothetical protein HanPI659440_Chr06g0247421 [Helianthus annuus]|nr:hypothetical protein HanPI659440_Chr06g0247421 [Helianthus annuus]
MLTKDLNRVTTANKINGKESQLGQALPGARFKLTVQIVICNKHVENDGCIYRIKLGKT